MGALTRCCTSGNGRAPALRAEKERGGRRKHVPAGYLRSLLRGETSENAERGRVSAPW